MRKSFVESIASVAVGTLVCVLFGVSRRIAVGEYLLLVVLNALWVGAVFMAVDELVFKLTYYRDLVNWQELAGEAGAFAAIWCFTGFVWSGSMTELWIYLALAVGLGVADFVWWLIPYTYSVKTMPELDKFLRAKYAKRITRAALEGKTKKLVRYFSRIVRFRSLGDGYEAGSDVAHPYDDRYRTLAQVRLTAPFNEADKLLAKSYEADFKRWARQLVDKVGKANIKEEK